MKYIVLYKNKARIGSVELNDKNELHLNDKFYLHLIQIDVTGTKHYSVLRIKEWFYTIRK